MHSEDLVKRFMMMVNSMLARLEESCKATIIMYESKMLSVLRTIKTTLRRRFLPMASLQTISDRALLEIAISCQP